MSTEDRLRDLLTRVVPDPPGTPSPHEVVSVGRRARRRRRRVIVGAATAVVVAAVTVVPAAVHRSAPSPAPDVPDRPSLGTRPYDAAPCPAVEPRRSAPPVALVDFQDSVGVRLCRYPLAVRAGDLTPAVDSRGSVAPDALVDGVAGLGAALRELPDVDPDRCRTANYVAGPPTYLLVQPPTGDPHLVELQFCGVSPVGGKELDSSDVRTAFLDALDRQREAYSYAPATLPEPACGGDTDSPSRPGREQLVAAVVCAPVVLTPRDDPDPESTRLDPEQLALLQERWLETAPPPADRQLDEMGEDPCTELEDTPSTLVAVTDRGDLVPGNFSPCGFVDIASVWPQLRGQRVPLSLDELQRH